MKIVEVVEDVKFVNDTDHAIERVKVAAEMCNELGNTPILYRMFKGGESSGRGAKNLMIKVDNTGRKGVKGNTNIFQKQIFDALQISNPTQALVSAPDNITGFHGTNFIMIPSSDFKAYWNPEIPDLGSFYGYKPEYQKKDGKSRERPLDYDVTEEVERAVAGYKQGVPGASEWDGEIIVDTAFYYMLNLHEFLSKYAGKKSQELVRGRPGDARARALDKEYGAVKKDLLQAKFNTYRDLGWYLSNPTMNFLNWFKQKESEKQSRP